MLDKSDTIRVKVTADPNTTPHDRLLAPVVPTGLAATPGDSKVTLKWNPVADKDLKHYTVYWSLPGKTATEVNTTSTSYTVTGLDQQHRVLLLRAGSGHVGQQVRQGRSSVRHASPGHPAGHHSTAGSPPTSRPQPATAQSP